MSENSNCIVGDWRVTSFSETEELRSQSTRYKTYSENGQFDQLGFYIISFIEDGKASRAVTAAYAESGTWSQQDGSIHEQINQSITHLFSSSIEEFDRQAYETDESRNETVIYVIDSVENGVMLLHEKAEPNDRYQMKAEPIVSATNFMRLVSLRVLEQDGFVGPTQLEIGAVDRPLKSIDAIMHRALSLYTVICWVSSSKSTMPSKRLKQLIKDFNLEGVLTAKENEILALSRKAANQQFADTIGQQIESLWVLAWALGFEETPDIDQGPIAEELIAELVPFIESVIDDLPKFLARTNVRPVVEVVQLEDLFCCAANVVQLGDKKAVPESFNPEIDSEVLYKKRDALAWLLDTSV